MKISTVEDMEIIFRRGCNIIHLLCTQAVMSIPLKIFRKYYGLEIAECRDNNRYKKLNLKLDRVQEMIL